MSTKKSTTKRSALDTAHERIKRARETAENAQSGIKELDCFDSDAFKRIIRDLLQAEQSLLRAEFKGSSRHTRWFAAARRLQAFCDSLSDTNSHNTEEVSLRLTEMAGWMINETPAGGQLARDIYLAIGRAWDAARCEWDGPNMDHPTEQQIVSLHRELMEELRGEGDSRRQQELPADVDSKELIKQLMVAQVKLAHLEQLPENEAIRFQLETEIDRLKRELGAEPWEWPDVIGEGAGDE